MITRTLIAARQNLRITLVIGTVALIAAACGASMNSGRAAAAGGGPLKEAQCMRSHGVPRFPDPKPGGPSVVPNWINPQAAAFQSALKVCSKFVSGGGASATGHESEKIALLNLAKCIRAHGLPSFPDPTTTPPGNPPAGSHTGNAMGIGGAYLVFPPPSPALKHAEAQCGFTGP